MTIYESTWFESGDRHRLLRDEGHSCEAIARPGIKHEKIYKNVIYKVIRLKENVICAIDICRYPFIFIFHRRSALFAGSQYKFL